MPQATKITPQTNGNEDTPAIDPQKDPLSFVYQNRDALSRMDPDKAVKFADMMFRRYALPKYQQINKQRPLDEEEIDNLRLQFAARLFDIPFDQQTRLKEPKRDIGLPEKVGQAASAAGAGVIGGLRTIEELHEKLAKIPMRPPGGILHGSTEGRAYEEAKSVIPRGADIAAGIGHQIPSSIAASGAGSVIPGVAKTASLGTKVLTGGIRGALEGSTFEATRPGGSPSSGATWGGILGAAFPILGKMFGLGRQAIASAPKAAGAVEGGLGASTAKAASEAPKSLGDVAEQAAKSKFGKSFKDLTSAEKAQMPQFMKEEIAKQRVQQAATKKAEAAAAKASKEAEAVAKRAEKAKAASEKAAKQATTRSETGASTATQKQAVAAQAAAENPSIAKTLGSETEEEHAIRTRGMKTPPGPTPEQIKAEEELRLTKEAEENLKKQGLGTTGKVKQVLKISEGETGPKVRAKGGQPASPAQQAADRERIAAKRAEAKSQEFGAALEKHAQQMAGKYTSTTQVGVQHIPELEGAVKEIEGGDVVLRGLQKMRRVGKISDEIYADSLKEWLLNQFSTAKEGL